MKLGDSKTAESVVLSLTIKDSVFSKILSSSMSTLKQTGVLA